MGSKPRFFRGSRRWTLHHEMLSLVEERKINMTRNAAFLVLLSLCVNMTGCNCCARQPKDAIQMKLPIGTPQGPQRLKALVVKPGPEPFTKDDVPHDIRRHWLAKA